MSGISHRQINVNGLDMHVAEAGTGPLVVLCHGWPECWYSWRAQLTALAEAGYHAVAPDQRGYGQTEAPQAIDAYALPHLVGDIVGLVHALGETQAVVVGHDWGAPVAWTCAQWRPDLFRGVAALSVPVRPRGSVPPMQAMRVLFADRFFYQLYFQTPGVAEHEFQRDVGATMRKLLVGASGAVARPGGLFDPRRAPPRTATMLEYLPDPGDDLPDWLSREDLAYLVDTFERTGFRGGLNWYRNIDRNWELGAAFDGRKVECPALFVAGEVDVVPFNDDAQSAMRSMVPDLREVKLLPGVGHWTQQEAPEAVNAALTSFLADL